MAEAGWRWAQYGSLPLPVKDGFSLEKILYIMEL